MMLQRRNLAEDKTAMTTNFPIFITTEMTVAVVEKNKKKKNVRWEARKNASVMTQAEGKEKFP